MGCVDINMWHKNFTVEKVMERLAQSIREHNEGSMQNGLDCHLRPKDIEVSIN